MPRTVLVVDNSKTIRDFIAISLKLLGLNIIAVADGMEALEKLPTSKIDLVMTELNMPNIDGYTLIKTLRNNPAYKLIPIIIYSSLAKAENIQLGYESGASVFLTKPFNSVRLQNEIIKVIERFGI